MPTTVTKTIGSGGDYTTLQSWEDAAPANLVTSDQIWRGEIKAASDGFSAALSISGSTSDSTRYKELTTAAGASWRDNANVQTNALKYNSANGCYIAANLGGYTNLININENYSRISNLQLSSTGNTQCLGMGATGVDVNNCILEGAKSAVMSMTAGTLRNTLVVQRQTSASSICTFTGGAAYNCTFVTPSDLAKSTSAFGGSGYGTITLQNCAIFGATNLRTGSHPTFNCTTCVGDVTYSGVTTVAYDTSTGSGFQGTTNAAGDWRIKSSSAMVNAGTTDATNAPIDIAGTARPSGASYDVGAWEYVSGGGSSFTPKSLKPLLQAIGGMY